jgi:hypothetical protein
MIRDKAAGMIVEGIQKAVIFTDSQAALNRIQHNGIGAGQTWALGIIRSTEYTRKQNIQLELKAMNRPVNLQRIQGYLRMKKRSHQKMIRVHLLAIYGGVLPMPNGSDQMNGLSASVVVGNTIASMTATNQKGNCENRKFDGPNLSSDKNRPCSNWSTFRLHQETRRRHVLVGQSRCSTNT